MGNSKADEIYASIMQMIINKEVKPGNQLKEEKFAGIFKVSRTTIRKALVKLKNDGFVESIHQKGSYVIDPSIEDISSAYKFRTQLESLLLCEELIEKAKPKDINVLEKYIEL
jgi:DNA-binding GntR family transcriptional regulator